MSSEGQPTGRLAGAKAPSYVRAVNVPEARASRHTARYMLLSDIAYVLSASELGYTPRSAGRNLVKALLELLDELETLDTSSPPGDIVSQREAWVAARVDRADAGWLHLGRNRGESLRVLLPRLFFRHCLHEQRRSVLALLRSLLDQARTTLDAAAPMYHHLQHSGITTLGEYLLSWATVLRPHLERIDAVDRRLDKGPPPHSTRPELQALYDRVIERLGFSGRARLRRESLWTHEQFTEPFGLLVQIAVDVARLAQDLRIWMTPEFGLFELADQHAGGSSALPHAKVPFGLQAVIGGATIAVTRLAGELAAAINPSEGSEPIYQSASLYGMAEDIVAWTVYLADVIEHGRFNLDELARKSTLDYAGSSEAHDRLVYELGVPFRPAHRILGGMVRAHYHGEKFDLGAALARETGRPVVVDQDEIMDMVLGVRQPDNTIDVASRRAVLSQSEIAVREAAAAAAQPGVVERATRALIAEAEHWLSQP